MLINGTVSGLFCSPRGLRHENFLSPDLFVIVMEALSCLRNKAKLGGLMVRWRVSGRGREGEKITHL